MTEYDIIQFLQSYKGYLQAFLGHPVILSLKADGIRHTRTSGPNKTDDILIDRCAHIPVLSVQVRAGCVLRLVDSWMRLLDDAERVAVFRLYIDHEFGRPQSGWERYVLCERGAMRYKTTSYRRLESETGKTIRQLRQAVQSGMSKILEEVNGIE